MAMLYDEIPELTSGAVMHQHLSRGQFYGQVTRQRVVGGLHLILPNLQTVDGPHPGGLSTIAGATLIPSHPLNFGQDQAARSS